MQYETRLSEVFEVRDERQWGFFLIDNRIIEQHGEALGPYGIAVYCYLAMRADSERECYPSYLTIAKALSMSRRMAVAKVKQLAKLGLLRVERRKSAKKEPQPNVFRLLTIPGSAPDALVHLMHHMGSAPDALGSAPDAPKQDPRINTQGTEYPPIVPPQPITPSVEDYWQAFFIAYPKRQGALDKAKGREQFERLLKAGTDPAAVIDGAKRYAAWCQATGALGGPYVRRIPTFLNNRGWEEEYDVWQEPSGNGATPADRPRTMEAEEAMARDYYAKKETTR